MDARTAKPLPLPPALRVTAVLAQLLQRLEASREPVAGAQYRSVVDHLAQCLRDAPQGPALDAIFQAFPAAAELYENLHYDHAGLCRSPLEASLNAELEARAAIGRAARH